MRGLSTNSRAPMSACALVRPSSQVVAFSPMTGVSADGGFAVSASVRRCSPNLDVIQFLRLVEQVERERSFVRREVGTEAVGQGAGGAYQIQGVLLVIHDGVSAEGDFRQVPEPVEGCYTVVEKYVTVGNAYQEPISDPLLSGCHIAADGNDALVSLCVVARTGDSA